VVGTGSRSAFVAGNCAYIGSVRFELCVYISSDWALVVGGAVDLAVRDVADAILFIMTACCCCVVVGLGILK